MFKKEQSLKASFMDIREKLFENNYMKRKILEIKSAHHNPDKLEPKFQQYLDDQKSFKKIVNNIGVVKLGNENLRLYERIKNISIRSSTPYCPPKKSKQVTAQVAESYYDNFDKFRMSKQNVKNNIRKTNMKNLQSENEMIVKRIIRVNSPLSKYRIDMSKENKKHDILVNNNKHIKGFKNGHNKRVERLISPYLPKIQGKLNSSHISKNNSPSLKSIITMRLDKNSNSVIKDNNTLLSSRIHLNKSTNM